MIALNLKGQKFGRLTVIRRDGTLHKRSAWLCICDCGTSRRLPASSLTKGLTTSCGCWRRERSAVNTKPSPVVRYRMAHQRIVNTKGSASEHACTDCGATASEWSYDHQDQRELHEANRAGRLIAYSLDPAHYVPRCRPCHRVFDLAQTA